MAFQIRSSIPFWQRILLGVAPVFTLLGLWIVVTLGEAEARIVSPLILPSPLEVLKSFPSLWFEAELSRSAIASFWRVLQGFAVGIAVAFPLGLLMGAVTPIKAAFKPLATFLSYTPIPALVPLTMSLFGIDELQKVMFLALAFFIYLLPMIVNALDSVHQVYLQTVYTLGATPLQAIRHVLLPIALPDIFQAMRAGFGVGWTYIILAEMVAADRGLGQIIIIAQRRGPREHIYLALLAIVAIAFATDKLWAMAHDYLFPYRKTK